MSVRIGVLALQGDFDAHRRRVMELGAEVLLIKAVGQLAGIDALILPGGESTALVRLLGDEGLDALRAFCRLKPVFGTCAGAILLATNVEPSGQPSLGAIDMTIRRNAYGRQIDSTIRTGTFGGAQTEMVFIRAPRIERTGSGVEVLASLDGEPVAVRQGHVLAATFHPELASDPLVHRAFLAMVQAGPG